MFKQLFTFFKLNLDAPSIMFKLNIWSYMNIRLFKIKTSRSLIFLISIFNSLQLKRLSIFYKDWDFNYFFFKYFYFVIYIIILFLLVL